MLAADHARVRAGLHQNAFCRIRLGPIDLGNHTPLLIFELGVERIVFRKDDGNDGKIVLARELEVALIAAGYRHDRARAVIGHHIIGNPDGYLLAIDRVHHIATREDAMLVAIALSALERRDLLSRLREFHDRLLVFRTRNQRLEPCIFRGQHEEAATEQRIGAGGEHRDDFVSWVAPKIAQCKIDLRAFGTPDPIRLLLLHAIRPAFELIEIVQQLLRIVGDLVVPLRKVALLNLGIATPAAPFESPARSQAR